jgi:hypothetical protein
VNPYVDIETTEKYVIRKFDENVDPIELMWHRDNEHRTLYLQGETNWKIQLENELPTTFVPPIFIPKHKYHRLIKGTGDLILKIYKYD